MPLSKTGCGAQPNCISVNQISLIISGPALQLTGLKRPNAKILLWDISQFWFHSVHASMGQQDDQHIFRLMVTMLCLIGVYFVFVFFTLWLEQYLICCPKDYVLKPFQGKLTCLTTKKVLKRWIWSSLQYAQYQGTETVSTRKDENHHELS